MTGTLGRIRAIVITGFILLVSGCETPRTLNPMANAGDNQVVLVGDLVGINGLSSTDVASASWEILSQPSGSSAVISTTTPLEAEFTADVAGTYVIELALNDRASRDTVTVTAKTVLAGISNAPGSTIREFTLNGQTAYAINLEQAGGILTANSSRGNIVSYAWTQVEGPPVVTADGTVNVTLGFSSLSLADFLHEADRYKWQVLPVSRDDAKMVFLLLVSDSEGNQDKATFTVYVHDNNVEIPRSHGLPNVAIGSVVYLSGANLLANNFSASSTISAWRWALTPPAGSSSFFADAATTASTLQLPKFVPDVPGAYNLAYSSTLDNDSDGPSGSFQVNASDWVGVGVIGNTVAVDPQCGACHDGSEAADKVTSWSETDHATIFEENFPTYATLAPDVHCWACHTVGFDPAGSNSGFDDRVSQAGYAGPVLGDTFEDFTSENSDIVTLANVQCENCHGPGNQHSGESAGISHSFSQAGVCGQCHREEAQWKNSAHNSTGVAHGRGLYQNTLFLGASCARCHSSKGFDQYLEGGHGAVSSVSETGAFPGITCAACHDPHSVANPSQLRAYGNVTMIVDGSTVDAGKAAACYKCHDGFYTKDEVDCDSNGDGVADGSDANGGICTTIDQTATQYFRQVHYNPQAPVLEGKGALTDLNGDASDDFHLTQNSFHSKAGFTLAFLGDDLTLSSDNDKCVTCHMATPPGIEEDGHNLVGGHAFKQRSAHSIGHLEGEETGESSEDGEAGDVENIAACTTCHPALTTFNRTARNDYDGDGNLEGIQDEIKGLLLAVSNKIKAVNGTNVNGSTGTTEDAGVITVGSLGWTGTSTSGSCPDASVQPCNFAAAADDVKRAVWNHNLIVRDSSLGVHNAAFAVQVLQGTYSALSTLNGGSTFVTDFPDATIR